MDFLEQTQTLFEKQLVLLPTMESKYKQALNHQYDNILNLPRSYHYQVLF